MALTNTLVKHEDKGNFSSFQNTISDMQLTVDEELHRVDYIQNHIDDMRKQFKKKAVKVNDNSISKISSECMTRQSEIIKTPEVFFSPRKDDDNYHDVESIGVGMKYPEDESVEISPTYTARSFKIKSDECFDANDDSSQSENSFKLENPVIKINKTTNQLYQNDNSFTKLWSDKSLENVDVLNNVSNILSKRSEMMLIKLASSRKRSSSQNNKILMKSHFISKEKNKTSARKDDESIISKVKKVKMRKTRIKSSISRSTTASKHVNILPEGRRPKKPKRRGKQLKDKKKETPRINVYQCEDEKIKIKEIIEKIPEINKKDENKKEIVELFTNVAARSDQSLSAESSDPKFKFNVQKPIRQVVKKITKPIRKEINPEGSVSPVKNPKIEEKKYISIKPEMKIKIKPDGDRTLSRKKDSVKEENIKHEDECQLAPARNFSYDPLIPPTYQRPTIASENKRNNRCYYGRYNYQYIPFVVGTSINRTHNIGLNIQLALGLMKARQPSRNTDIRPVLIKKFRRGLDPSYNLLENFNQLEENFRGDYDSSRKSQRQENIELTQSELLQQTEEELNRETEHRVKTPTIDMNHIREIMVELHDNYEKLHLKYMKLEEQAEKSTDKEKLETELKKLEDELAIKEEEINQIVVLYKELMAKTVNQNSKTPSTSTRLTALLRKIQSFQQQLISS